MISTRRCFDFAGNRDQKVRVVHRRELSDYSIFLVKSKDVTIENDLISQRRTEAYALMKTEMSSSSEQEIFTWSVKIIKKGFQTKTD